jgi:DNA polymerase IV
MAPLSLHDFPRAILHIDGDAFFASCEQSRRPKLQGRPVVTGKERGIAASMSYEAKARGVTRGMRLAEIRKRCPEAVILPSDYETYSLLSKRFFAIVRRYTPEVEAYSIDECFCDLTGLRRPLRMSYLQIAERIKQDLDTALVAWQSSIDRLSPVGSPSRNGLWFDEKENPHGQISGHPHG